MLERLNRLLTIKSLVTLAATGVFCALALKGVIDPSQFMTVFVTIIGFYFGTQSAQGLTHGEAVTAALGQGLYAGMFVFLLLWVLKKNDEPGRKTTKPHQRADRDAPAGGPDPGGDERQAGPHRGADRRRGSRWKSQALMFPGGRGTWTGNR